MVVPGPGPEDEVWPKVKGGPIKGSIGRTVLSWGRFSSVPTLPVYDLPSLYYFMGVLDPCVQMETYLMVHLDLWTPEGHKDDTEWRLTGMNLIEWVIQYNVLISSYLLLRPLFLRLMFLGLSYLFPTVNIESKPYSKESPTLNKIISNMNDPCSRCPVTGTENHRDKTSKTTWSFNFRYPVLRSE